MFQTHCNCNTNSNSNSNTNNQVSLGLLRSGHLNPTSLHSNTHSHSNQVSLGLLRSGPLNPLPIDGAPVQSGYYPSQPWDALTKDRWTKEWDSTFDKLKSNLNECIANFNGVPFGWGNCIDTSLNLYHERQELLLTSDNRFTLEWTKDWEYNWNEFLQDLQACSFFGDTGPLSVRPNLFDCFKNHAYDYKSKEKDLLWEFNDHTSLPHTKTLASNVDPFSYPPRSSWDAHTRDRWTKELNEAEQGLKSALDQCIDSYAPREFGNIIPAKYNRCVDALFSNYQYRKMHLLNSALISSNITLTWTIQWEYNWNEFLQELDVCSFEATHLIDCFKSKAYDYKIIETDLLWELNNHESLPHPLWPHRILETHTVNTQIHDNAHMTQIIPRGPARVGTSVHTIYEQDGKTHIHTEIHHC